MTTLRFPTLLLLAAWLCGACAPRALPAALPPGPADLLATALAAGTATPTPFQPVLETPTVTPSPPAPTPTPAPSPTVTPPVLPTLGGPLNPLTGLPPFSPDRLQRRPIAVKVTLFPRYARPEYGLTRADVVYEYYIEDGLSRFVAVFWGDDAEKVGPVRSGRFFDEHIARMYQSYLVFKSADDRVEEYFSQLDIHNFFIVPTDRNCPPLCSDPAFVARTGDAYNSWYFDTVGFQEFLARYRWKNDAPSLRSAYFSYFPSLSDQPATRIATSFSDQDYHYWEYDPASRRYLRFQETRSARDPAGPAYAPLMDALTGAQVFADNVVVIYVPYTFENENQREDEVYHIDLFGSGPAYLFRDGVAMSARWERDPLDQPLRITDPAGNELALRPGVTYYEVLGVSSTLSRADATWNFAFVTP